MVMRIPMTVMAIISSMRVKPCFIVWLWLSYTVVGSGGGLKGGAQFVGGAVGAWLVGIWIGVIARYDTDIAGLQGTLPAGSARVDTVFGAVGL